jgi:phosphatidylserine/phosphatidylglycerophosphate/cardiolipin synthase-like enzyme
MHLSGPTHRHGHAVSWLVGRLLLERLQAVGTQAVVRAVQPISHRKVMIIDGETVITRSFNLTKATRERNTERLLIFHDPGLAKQYPRNWETHQPHRQP